MWLHLPSKHSASLPDAEVSISASDSLCQTLARSVMWRSTFRRPQSWALVLRTGVYQKLLSGLTLSSSMASRGAALWISSLADFPAPTSPSPESKPESKGNTPGSGLNTSASFARFDQNSCLLRTSRQFSLFPQEQPYLEGLPKAGSMRSGFLFERPTLALRTDESASSSWPTARAEDSECCGNHQGAQDSLGGATRNWGTPRANDSEKQGSIAGDPRNGVSGQAVNWGTPRVTTNNGIGCPDSTGKGSRIEDQAENWRTPNTRDAHPHGPRLSAKQRQLTLVDQAERGLSE